MGDLLANLANDVKQHEKDVPKYQLFEQYSGQEGMYLSLRKYTRRKRLTTHTLRPTISLFWVKRSKQRD